MARGVPAIGGHGPSLTIVHAIAGHVLLGLWPRPSGRPGRAFLCRGGIVGEPWREVDARDKAGSIDGGAAAPQPDC
jgi:hypothetical protein